MAGKIRSIRTLFDVQYNPPVPKEFAVLRLASERSRDQAPKIRSTYMRKRFSIDEIVEARKGSANDSGTLFTAVVLDAEEAKGYDADKRAQKFVMSTESTDLYGDIVRQAGLKLDNFLKNPVALAYHRHDAPVGWWSDVKMVSGRPKRTEGVLTLHAPGTSEKVDEIERLLQASAIRACSIGFKPLEAEWILDEEGRNTWGFDFVESLLLECSVCSIPANPEALAKAAGGDMKLAAELFERVLDTYCEVRGGGLYVRKEFEAAYRKIKDRPAPRTSAGKDSVDLALKIDTKDAEEQVAGLLEKLRKGMAEIFGAHAPAKKDWSGYGAITFRKELVDGKTKIMLVDADWPTKICAHPEVLMGPSNALNLQGDVLTFRLANGEAEYRRVGRDEEADLEYFDLIRGAVTQPEESEPGPKGPALIPHSRAKAIVQKARMMESLRSRGLIQ